MARQRRYRVGWTEGAARDVEGIARYVANESHVAAAELRSDLIEAAESLETHPRRGHVVPELQSLGIDLWRELIVGNYRIIYRLQAPSRLVLIFVVLDARRDVEHVLLERLIGY